AKKLNTKLLELLENNGDINTAFASFNDEFWADFLKAYNKANNKELNLDELMSLRADKITLSKALYTGLKESKNSVKSVIKTAIKEQKSANELAKMLYEGYDFKADPLKVKRKFPKYLWEKSAKTKVKNIKTPALRTAYSKLLKDESKLVANKALKVAGYEKARYYAKRIALNETARAYNDARAFEYANSSDIQVVKIQMSITHPRTDICDYYAGVDKYGLGAGVYPKDKAPVPPFHPFCRCQMIPRYADEYAKPKLNANADKEYLSGLKEWQRARILGSKAKANEALKTGDINSVFNAMKPERYKVKSINEVAKQIKDDGFYKYIGINEKSTEGAKFLYETAKNDKVEYITPNFLKNKLSEDEIIKKVSGGDLTQGSCVSVALAYLANKAGFDGRDFRGGTSRRMFSTKARVLGILKDVSIKYYNDKATNNNAFKDMINVLKEQENKEFLMLYGRHCAIVKKDKNSFKYLELQSNKDEKNGWTSFKVGDRDMIKARFGAIDKDEVTFKGETIKKTIGGMLIDAQSLVNSKEFHDIIGYFNTLEGKELKGKDGNIK
ncbi:MAG: hypothetical protein SOU37_01620, partial [Campylobacter lanienae]|nr:hypothetical protein [Campylobacteraceae bacterium]MDY2817300.1 hypothetical protein [Campylobacter lanienae]